MIQLLSRQISILSAWMIYNFLHKKNVHATNSEEMDTTGLGLKFKSKIFAF